MIRLIRSGYDVAEAVRQLESQPDVWNRYTLRTDAYAHRAVDDVWCRYNAWGNWNGDVAAFNGPHESVWYPVIGQLPAVWSLVRRVMRDMAIKTLGGVLITRIPPGGRVEPHIDNGWHARHYEKFAVQLRGNDRQAFHFEDAELRAQPGDLYTFDNSRLHWVTNDSDEDRITLIICGRRDPMLEQDEMVPFDMYFASLVSMQVHPGAGSKEHKPLSLDECRRMALEMIQIRREVGGR